VDTGEVQVFDEKDIALSREIERSSLQQNDLVTFSNKEDLEEDFLPRLRSANK
jgi:hypothetical protein